MSDRTRPLYSHHTETLQLFKGLVIICLPALRTADTLGFIWSSYGTWWQLPGKVHRASCDQGTLLRPGKVLEYPSSPFLTVLAISTWDLSLWSFPLLMKSSSTFSVQADGSRCHSSVEPSWTHIGCKESSCHYYSISHTGLLNKNLFPPLAMELPEDQLSEDLIYPSIQPPCSAQTLHRNICWGKKGLNNNYHKWLFFLFWRGIGTRIWKLLPYLP